MNFQNKFSEFHNVLTFRNEINFLLRRYNILNKKKKKEPLYVIKRHMQDMTLNQIAVAAW